MTQSLSRQRTNWWRPTSLHWALPAFVWRGVSLLWLQTPSDRAPVGTFWEQYLAWSDDGIVSCFQRFSKVYHWVQIKICSLPSRAKPGHYFILQGHTRNVFHQPHTCSETCFFLLLFWAHWYYLYGGLIYFTIPNDSFYHNLTLITSLLLHIHKDFWPSFLFKLHLWWHTSCGVGDTQSAAGMFSWHDCVSITMWWLMYISFSPVVPPLNMRFDKCGKSCVSMSISVSVFLITWCLSIISIYFMNKCNIPCTVSIQNLWEVIFPLMIIYLIWKAVLPSGSTCDAALCSVAHTERWMEWDADFVSAADQRVHRAFHCPSVPSQNGHKA